MRLFQSEGRRPCDQAAQRAALRVAYAPNQLDLV